MPVILIEFCCSDVNECALGIDNCHPDAMCVNSEGIFDCRCPIGFRGDGVECCVSELTLTALIQAEGDEQEEQSKSTKNSRKSKSKKKRKGRSGKLI